MPWRSWKPFGTASATYVAQNADKSQGDGLRAAQHHLRHSHEGVTAEHYVKNSRQDRKVLRAYRARKIECFKDQARDVIGQGLKEARPN